MASSESRSARHAARLTGTYRAALQNFSLPQRTAAALAQAPQPCAVLAVGKSAGPMMDGARTLLRVDVPCVAILPDGVPLPGGSCEVLRTAHPLPDARVNVAARRALEVVALSSETRPLWLCLSGGGSACLGAPLPGTSVEELARLTRALMLAGADIGELNTVRKHACQVLGGRLGHAAAGLVVAVAVDIANEDVGLVASGPAWVDASTVDDAVAVLRRRGVDRAGVVLVPSPQCPAWPHHGVAAPSHWRAALAAEAGPDARVVTRTLQTVEDVERLVVAPGAGTAENLVAVGEVPFAVPPNAPAGGRAAHLALWLALRLARQGGRFVVLCAGSDGRDGPTEHAGACVSDETLAGVDAGSVEAALAAGGAHSWLLARGALIPRLATGLNLLDALLVWRES
jgi:hydroxypyruvate reductase